LLAASGKLGKIDYCQCGWPTARLSVDLHQSLFVFDPRLPSRRQQHPERLAGGAGCSTRRSNAAFEGGRHYMVTNQKMGEGSMLFDRMREGRSLHLLVGFLLGCAVAAVAVSTLRDWAW
jgi:hypothetical protein